MLNGVGGRTIAEAKERLSYPEFCSWLRYRNKRGGLNAGLRVEWCAAMLASLYCHANSKKSTATLYDFAPHIDEPPITMERAMKEWR